MAQAPTDIQDGADIDLEKQVDLLLTEIDQTADRIESRAADGAAPAPKAAPAAQRQPEIKAPAPSAATTPPATPPETKAPQTADRPPRAAATATPGVVLPPIGVASAPAAGSAASQPIAAPAAPAPVPAETVAAPASPVAPTKGLDAEVDQLLADATASPLVVTPDKIGAVNQAAESPTKGPEPTASAAPAAKALTIGQVDEQLSGGAEAAIEDAVAGDFLAPSEVAAPSPATPAAPAVAAATAPAAPSPVPAPAAAGAGVTIAAPKAAPAPSVAAATPSPKDASKSVAAATTGDAIATPNVLARALFSGGVALNLPLLKFEPKWRDTAGWVALNTLFIAVCLWMYLFLRPAPGAPEAHTPEAAAQHEGEGHSSGGAKAKPEGHSEAKPKPKEEHKSSDHGAKNKESAKAKEHAGPEKKTAAAKHE